MLPKGYLPDSHASHPTGPTKLFCAKLLSMHLAPACTELFHPCSSAVAFTELVSPSLQPVGILLKESYSLQFQSSFSNPAKLCFLNFIPMCLGNVSVFLQSSWTPLTYTIFWIRSEEFLIQEASGKGWVYFSCSQIWAIVYWMLCIIYGILCRLRKPWTFLQGKQILRNSSI